MVVDGRTSSRRELTENLASCDGFEVVGTAINARTALGKMNGYAPDIVAVDVSTPDVEGADLARHLVEQGGIGVILMADDLEVAESIRRQQGMGRCGVLPRNASAQPVNALAVTIRDAWQGVVGGGSAARAAPEVRAVAPSKERPKNPSASPAAESRLAAAARSPKRGRARAATTSSGGAAPVASVPARPAEPVAQASCRVARKPIEMVAICTSTGGPEALGKVLPHIPADFPRPILIVQHMPPGFTASLAASLDRASQLSVREASEGEAVVPGTAYLAPGGQHLGVAVRDGKRVVALSKGPPENSCRPAADYLLRSLSDLCGGGVLVVMMTGMGEDGLKGCVDLYQRGATILAQDEASCVVYGMPRGPVERGLASVVAPVESLASHICRSTEKVAIK